MRKIKYARYLAFLLSPVEARASLSALAVLSALMGVGLVSYAATPAVTYAETSRDWQWFVSSAGYRLRYPISWQVIEGEPAVFRFEDEEVSVSTVKKFVASGLFPDATVQFVLHATPATRYRDAHPISGQPIDRVVVVRPDGQAHEIRGTGPAFEMIVSSFTLISTK